MRTCGTCAACCRWPSIEEISKPAKMRCRHLQKRGHGCKIYAQRPEACADYRCSWLRGIGGEDDQPDRCGVMIDRRVTQFGHVLVAHQLKPGAAMSEKGSAAIQHATRDEGLPCLVADFKDVDLVIGAAGPPAFIAEVESKSPGARVGGQKDYLQNIVAHAMQGRVMPGLNDGW